MESKLKILELYSGVGGMHYALEESGLPASVVAAIDVNEVANRVYVHNFPSSTLLQRNIMSLSHIELNTLEPDVIMMSPPCQPFTRVGLKKDIYDGRTDSFVHVLSILPELHSVRYILVENVKGFETSETRNKLISTLEISGFIHQELLLSPHNFCIPNTRLRYYLIAKRKPLTFCFPASNELARALAAQIAESETIRFLVGTQSLKLDNNQIHVVELHEDSGVLSTQVYQHDAGEVWSLAASPADSSKIITCYNTLSESGCRVQAALWQLPSVDRTSASNLRDEGHELRQLEKVCSLEANEQGQDVRTVAFHPTDGERAVSVLDSQCVLWDLGQQDAKVVTTVSLEGKGQPRFTAGKWNPHHNYSQFATAHDSHVRSWDLRSPQTPAWSIESAHCQLVRDVDFNPNKQYYLATCGDDGCSKFWDSRDASEPIAVRSDHSHWVWQIRYNHFHDQLVLTSSSDSRVILTCMASISSEPYTNSGADDIADAECEQRGKLEDGVLATYEEHEDSVYCVEWSSADPWTFASLSYDGRLVINQVPREDKYKILL